MEKTPLALNLTRHRKVKGWSQEGAATAIGIKRSRLGSYEEGRAEPDSQTLMLICATYGVTDIAAFIGGELPAPQPTLPIAERYHQAPPAIQVAVDKLLS